MSSVLFFEVNEAHHIANSIPLLATPAKCNMIILDMYSPTPVPQSQPFYKSVTIRFGPLPAAELYPTEQHLTPEEINPSRLTHL